MIMKKIMTILSTVVLWTLLLASISFASGTVIEGEGDTMIGLDFPTYGWSVTNERGEVIGYRGVNLGIGYSAKNYFSPLEYDKFNSFWGWGTVAILVPYVEIGGDYVFTPSDHGSFWAVGGAIGLYSVRLSFSYRF